MKYSKKIIIILSLLLVGLFMNCFFIDDRRNAEGQENSFLASDEIVFYSNGSSFSPVIVLQSAAVVIWTWEDNTTSNSTTPVKNYESSQLRTNRLKITPWSAVRRINIGYDAGDGGSNAIEFVADQQVSLVQNLGLVAPYLKEWCSSYNEITSLDFSNFINIETIECYLSTTLNTVNLTNTPKLKRVCFEDNNLISLDLTDCNSLEDIRASRNRYTKLTYPTQKGNIWHLCVRSNPQFTDPYFFTNLSEFPKLTDLFIWDTNQQGDLIIPKTHLTNPIIISAAGNKFSSVDFTGALQNVNADGFVDLNYNQITNVNIAGCVQIKSLKINNNKLSSISVDQVLKQVDEFGTINGIVDLSFNQPPTFIGLEYIAKLKNRGWTVNTDPNIPIESISVSSASGTSITTDNGTTQLSATILPANATTQSVTWSTIDIMGKASISTSGLLTAEKDGTVKAIATATDGSGVTGELLITISNQMIPVENILVTSPESTLITTDNGTLQLSASILPTDATTQSVTWSGVDLTGKATISTSGLLTAEKNGTIKAIATANDGSGVKGELTITISNQVIHVESISVSSVSGNLITTDNGTLQLSASILPSDATTQSVTWSTIVITGKASISTSGLLTAEKDGTVKAIATASDGSGVKGELLINISNQIIPVESILVTSPELTAITTDNGTIQLSASLLPTDATNKSITWSVINLTGKASISASGLLTAEKDGTVKAIATATDGSGMKGELTITISNQVIPVETILVSSSSGNLITTDNGTIQLQASILPTDATTKTVTWSVVDLTGKASINTSGLLTAINDGTVKAIATANDGSGIKSELTISISNQVILIENLTIIDDLINDTIKGIGTKLKLKVVVTPQNATNISVIWNVENITGQANIDQNGELTTISSGKINVIVEALDGSNRSDKKEYTIAIPVLLQQHNYLENIRIFPNPTSGKIKIHFEKLPSDGVEIEIRNPLGQTFIRKQIYENISEWQLEKYPFSIYFVTITDKDKSTTHKIINGIAPK